MLLARRIECITQGPSVSEEMSRALCRGVSTFGRDVDETAGLDLNSGLAALFARF